MMWLALSLWAVCVFLLLVIILLVWGGDGDERPNVGVDIFDPRERGLADDATEEQLDEGMRLLRATLPREDLTDPDPDDPYEDITYAEAAPRQMPLITRSPIRRGWGVPTPIPPRPIGPDPGDTTIEFGRITGLDLADGYGPDEHEIRLWQAGARYIQPAIGWVTR